MSGSDLARASHLSRGYIGDLESGRANPSLATLRVLARTLSVPVEHLLSDGAPQEITFDAAGVQVHLRGQGAQELAEEDWQAIRDFVEFVRSKRRERKEG